MTIFAVIIISNDNNYETGLCIIMLLITIITRMVITESFP